MTTATDLLPWLNLLMVPAVGMLTKISAQLARLEAVQSEHARRLDRIDSDLAELRSP